MLCRYSRWLNNIYHRRPRPFQLDAQEDRRRPRGLRTTRVPTVARDINRALTSHLPFLARLDKLPQHIDLVRSGGLLRVWHGADSNLY